MEGIRGYEGLKLYKATHELYKRSYVFKGWYLFEGNLIIKQSLENVATKVLPPRCSVLTPYTW